MKPFNKCPHCGGELIEKEVEKILKGGNDTAIVKVISEVCLRCGERLYSKETVNTFEEIRNKLTQHKVKSFKLVGKTFSIA